MYRFYRAIPYGCKTDNIDKWGELPHRATRDIVFFNDETCLFYKTNDLDIKRNNRNKNLNKLVTFYSGYFEKKLISVVLYIFNVKKISTISNQIKTIKKKLVKKHIDTLAHYWQRDIGENEFIPHFHVILVLERITNNQFQESFKGFCKGGPKPIFCDSLKDFSGYLKNKEFYAPNNKRNNSLSKILKRPRCIDNDNFN